MNSLPYYAHGWALAKVVAACFAVAVMLPCGMVVLVNSYKIHFGK